MSVRKELKALKHRLQDQGWRFRQGKGDHTVWYCPCGEHIVTMPGSPAGNKRSMDNLRATVARTCIS